MDYLLHLMRHDVNEVVEGAMKLSKSVFAVSTRTKPQWEMHPIRSAFDKIHYDFSKGQVR